MLQRGINTIGDLMARPELAARYLDLRDTGGTPPPPTIIPSAMTNLWPSAQTIAADGGMCFGSWSKRSAAGCATKSPLLAA